MPALPAPATTKRWSFSALFGRPFTFIAPYRPATAVAAVPCDRSQGSERAAEAIAKLDSFMPQETLHVSVC